MKRRCQNPIDADYKSYGGRGIRVCDRWLNPTKVKTDVHHYTAQGFLNFLEDMGPTWFSGATIDRIDNDGDYVPENCQWLTMRENVQKQQQTLLKNGTHILQSGEVQRRSNAKRVANGTHNFLKGVKGMVNAFDVTTGEILRISREQFLSSYHVKYFGPNHPTTRKFKTQHD